MKKNAIIEDSYKLGPLKKWTLRNVKCLGVGVIISDRLNWTRHVVLAYGKSLKRIHCINAYFQKHHGTAQ